MSEQVGGLVGWWVREVNHIHERVGEDVEMTVIVVASLAMVVVVMVVMVLVMIGGFLM